MTVTKTGIKSTAIQTPNADNLLLVSRQLKEVAEVGQRLRGDPNDSFVRVKELVSTGLFRLVNGTIQPPTASSLPGSVVPTSRLVATGGSVTGGGDLTADRTITLLNDNSTPGNNKLYGTDGSGNKGWFSQPTGLISPLNTKGDIWVFGATDTRLPVGSNGQVLLADSTQATGLRWGTSATGPQGPIGMPGMDGTDGVDGDMGPPGQQGLQGPTGSTGTQGVATYLEADQGPEGDMGPPGPAGPQGPQGPAGPTGAVGNAIYQITFGDEGGGGGEDPLAYNQLDLGISPVWSGWHTFNAPTVMNAFAGAETLKVNGAANQNAIDIKASTTTAQSYGLIIDAGTTSADWPLLIRDQVSSNVLFKIAGDGVMTFGNVARNPSFNFLGTGAATFNSATIDQVYASVVGGASLIRFRNTTAGGYTSLRLMNDQNNILRTLELDYSGSTYGSALVSGGPVGESGAVTTTGAFPLVLATNNSARIIISSTGAIDFHSVFTTLIGPAAGTAAPLPANPTGYFNLAIGGTVRQIPYY